jgi:hypothetical protein
LKIKTQKTDHINRFQKCNKSESLIDTESGFEVCVLAHQCFDDEPCPHLLALSRAEPLAVDNPRLQELRREL